MNPSRQKYKKKVNFLLNTFILNIFCFYFIDLTNAFLEDFSNILLSCIETVAIAERFDRFLEYIVLYILPIFYESLIKLSHYANEFAAFISESRETLR